MITAYITPPTAPRCKRCGEIRTVSGDRWICVPCKRNKPVAESLHTGIPDGPVLPKEAGRVYPSPPACHPWTDLTFQTAVRLAAKNAHHHIYDMGGVSKLHQAGAPGGNKRGEGFEYSASCKKVDTVVAPQDGYFVVYRCAEPAKQYRVPDAWLEVAMAAKRPTGELANPAHGFSLAAGSSKPAVPSLPVMPALSLPAGTRPMPKTAPWTDETFGLAVQRGCTTIHFRRFGEFVIIRTGVYGCLAKHPNAVNSSDEVIARVVFDKASCGWYAQAPHGLARYAVPQEWTHAN